MSRYKFSDFLIKVDDGNQILFYNILLRNYVETNVKELRKLQAAFNDADENSLLSNFVNEGIMLENYIDEYALFKYISNKIKYDHSILSITDVITLDCNLNCIYCMQQGIELRNDKERNSSLSPQDRVSLWLSLMNLFNAGAIVVTFFGGEPSLYPEKLSRIIRSAEKKQVPIKQYNIITNGVNFSDHMFEVLCNSKFRFIQITLDGPKHVHNRRRTSQKYKETWEMIINNIEKLLNKTNLTIVIHTVLDKMNSGEKYGMMIDELVDAFGENVIKERFLFNIGLLSHPNGSCAYTVENIPELAEYANIYVNTIKVALERGISLLDFLNIWPCTYRKETDLVIAPNGDLYNCISGVGRQKFRISSYSEFLDSPTNFLRLYSQFMESDYTDDECMNCIYLPICNGGCRFNAYVLKTKKDCWKIFHQNTYPKLLKLFSKFHERVKLV
ncbi:MAG TPA: radical SAM protein [Thermotogae bacterium]|nr:radical SAM protein [Thermotogota bacterium]